MQVQHAQSAYNNFDFAMKTSSGDTLSLAMYDNKELSYQEQKKDGTHTRELSLSHAYGYKFSYEGDGIDAQDRKEIEAALEQLQPELEAFMEKVKESGIPSPRTIADEAFSLRQMLPTPRDENHKSFLQDSILKAFDKELLKFSPQEKVLETAQKLFERLLEQMEHFSLYA
jgi:hypothetical protein